MSKPSTILSTLKTQLEGSSDLSYVKEVFIGARENILNYPCIIIEPLGIDESDDIHAQQELVLRVGIFGYINVMTKSKQIVGDANTKGITDFLNDTAKAICSDRTISSNALWTRIITTHFDFVEYPARNFAMEIHIAYRQSSTGRT